jgi:hypothetical protein
MYEKAKQPSRQRPVTVTEGRDKADAELLELYDTTGIDLFDLPAIMKPAQLAPAIGTTTGALAQDRFQKRGIPYIRLGSRNIRYVRADVARYLAANHGHHRPQDSRYV